MFIKVDVEGWEPEVIEGAAGVISNFRPILQLEISRSPSSSERWSKILGIIEESYEEVEVFGSRRGPFTSNDVRGVIQHLSLDQKLHNIVLWPKGSDDL